jgi:hypothetical protein
LPIVSAGSADAATALLLLAGLIGQARFHGVHDSGPKIVILFFHGMLPYSLELRQVIDSGAKPAHACQGPSPVDPCTLIAGVFFQNVVEISQRFRQLRASAEDVICSRSPNPRVAWV